MIEVFIKKSKQNTLAIIAFLKVNSMKLKTKHLKNFLNWNIYEGKIQENKALIKQGV